MLGWIGWTLCFGGNWLIGNRNRWGFLITFVSECVLLMHSISQADYSLSVACVAWMILDARNFRKWNP